jgi:hypothetical protein
LIEVGVVTVNWSTQGRPDSSGRPLYHLSGDGERISLFLSAMRQARMSVTSSIKKRVEKLISVGGGRHIHILSDDAFFPIRIENGGIQRDHLVAALFGLAPPGIV